MGCDSAGRAEALSAVDGVTCFGRKAARAEVDTASTRRRRSDRAVLVPRSHLRVREYVPCDTGHVFGRRISCREPVVAVASVLAERQPERISGAASIASKGVVSMSTLMLEVRDEGVVEIDDAALDFKTDEHRACLIDDQGHSTTVATGYTICSC